MYKSQFTKKPNVSSPPKKKKKNHLFQKGHTAVLLLQNQCPYILHFISFPYAESPQGSLPDAGHILSAKQAECYLNLDKTHGV